MTVGDERLLLLAARLDTVPRERFNYTQWVGRDWKGAQDLSCGTTACALGWAAAMPEFQALGMHLELYDDGGYQRGVVRLTGIRPELDDNGTLGVAMQVFELTYGAADYLFIPAALEGDASAQDVAQRIRDFVATPTEQRPGYDDETEGES